MWSYRMSWFDRRNINLAESYTDYPQAASENAKIALRWVDENGWGDCGTAVGAIGKKV